MIPQAYDERVTIGLRRLRLAPPAWRLHCVRAALAVLRSCCLSEGTGVPVDNIREEFGGEPVAAFSMSHPAVPALYIVLTLGLTMFSMQPVLIALSLAGGLAYGFATRGAARTLGALRWQLPVILIVAVLNPLFSASGSTELFRIGMRAVYLESMVYGLCMGGLFVASVLWFEAAGVDARIRQGARAAGQCRTGDCAHDLDVHEAYPAVFCAAVVRCWRCRMRLMCRAARGRPRALALAGVERVDGLGHGRFAGACGRDALARVGCRDASYDVCAVSTGVQRRCRAGRARAAWCCRGGGGVDRDDAVFVLSAALGAGAVAGLCRVRCLDGAALRVSCD